MELARGRFPFVRKDHFMAAITCCTRAWSLLLARTIKRLPTGATEM
jgi:hypothetical protein